MLGTFQQQEYVQSDVCVRGTSHSCIVVFPGVQIALCCCDHVPKCIDRSLLILKKEKWEGG